MIALMNSQEEIEALEKSVHEHRSSEYKIILGKAADLPEKSVLDEQLKFAKAALRKRKRICLQIIDNLQQDDRCRLTRKEILEAVGIDQSAG